MLYDRGNASLIGRWWWTIDRPIWFALIGLIVMGAVLVTAASPPVAARIGLPSFHFVHRHHTFLFLTLVSMFGISLLSPARVRQLSMITFLVAIVMMIALPVIGYENKGAVRRYLAAALRIFEAGLCCGDGVDFQREISQLRFSGLPLSGVWLFIVRRATDYAA